MDSAPAQPGPVTAVVIPVREAETIVRRRLLQVAPGLLPRDRGVAAHITLVAPFLPPSRIDDGVLDELAERLGDITSFGFALTEVCEFPDGTAYLSPEPAAPFRHLALDLHRQFPEASSGVISIDDVVPHLTVPLLPDETAADLRSLLRDSLPVTGHAVEANVVHVEEGNLHVVATLPFGVSAA